VYCRLHVLRGSRLRHPCQNLPRKTEESGGPLVTRMGSVACLSCGYVRWSPSTPCPSCGAPPDEVLPSTSAELIQRDVGSPDHPSIDVSFRVSVRSRGHRFRPSWSTPRRQRIAELVVVLALATVVLWATSPTWFGTFQSSNQNSVGTQTIFTVGSTETLPSSGPLEKNFDIAQPGSLVGEYRIGDGEAWILVDGCRAGGCSGNGTGSEALEYVSGSGHGGNLSVNLPSAGWYGLFVQGDGGDGSDRPLTVTWISPLEVVF